MRCRVETVTSLPNGTKSTKDREVTTSGNRIRIGRGTDNDIVLKDLAVAFRHADIVVRDFDLVVEAVAGSAVRFDEVAAVRGALTPGTVVGIGPYQIRLLPPERGFDLALSIETGEAAATAPPAPSAPLRLRGGILARRPLSWLLFAAVLLGFLVLPVLAQRGYQRDRAPDLAQGRAGGKPEATLLAGFDHVWDSGELSNPHKFLEQRCDACHVVPFQPIRNEDCGTCHAAVRHHFGDPTGVVAAALRSGGHEPARCTACHAEHQGADGAVPRQQALCVGCHQNLKSFAADSDLGQATDFGLDHPQFKPSVVTDAGAGKIERLELGGPVPVKESSGLVFDHLCHLGLKRIRPPADAPVGAFRCFTPDGLLAARSYPGPDGQEGRPADADGVVRYRIADLLEVDFPDPKQPLRARLTCASCHQPDAGGANMRPVSMENNCSYCHALQFDKDQPDRVLPHGKPHEVVDVLTYFYGAEAVRPPLLRTDPATNLRRRPGAKAELALAPAPAPATSAQPAAANAAFAKRLERVFADDGQSTCGYCHRTMATPSAKGVDYDVLPVQVQRVWEPLARFDHAAHTNLACAQCHAADASSVSSDVLMPPIATCRECHLGETASAAVPSTCTMCHVYHQERGTCPMVPSTGAIAISDGTRCPAATSSTTAGE